MIFTQILEGIEKVLGGYTTKLLSCSTIKVSTLGAIGGTCPQFSDTGINYIFATHAGDPFCLDFPSLLYCFLLSIGPT